MNRIGKPINAILYIAGGVFVAILAGQIAMEYIHWIVFYPGSFFMGLVEMVALVAIGITIVAVALKAIALIRGLSDDHSRVHQLEDELQRQSGHRP